MRLVIVPIVGIARRDLDALSGELAALGFEVEVEAEVRMPPQAYDPKRGQCRADPLLDLTRKYLPGHVLVVTDEDLYAGDLNFVFGVAETHGPGAVISLHRLRYGADARLLLQRAVKEAIHELGHTFGLRHCPDRRCVMTFSNSLADTDQKGRDFCRRCKRKIPAALRPAD